MKIHIKLFGRFAGLLPESSRQSPIEVKDGMTVAEAFETFHIPSQDPCLIFVNGRRASPHQVLCHGDAVSLFPVIAGG